MSVQANKIYNLKHTYCISFLIGVSAVQNIMYANQIACIYILEYDGMNDEHVLRLRISYQ
jgi:hypothetical protein